MASAKAEFMKLIRSQRHDLVEGQLFGVGIREGGSERRLRARPSRPNGEEPFGVWRRAGSGAELGVTAWPLWNEGSKGLFGVRKSAWTEWMGGHRLDGPKGGGK